MIGGCKPDKARVVRWNDITPDDRVFFLHLTKSAGTSFRTSMKSNYGEQLYFFSHPLLLPELQPKGLDGYRAITGEVFFGSEVFNLFDGPFVLLTILREPVSRILSWYNFLKATPNHGFSAEANARSLRDIFETKEDPIRLRMSNFATKQISGNPSFRNVTRSNLDEAKYYLENFFSGFGLVEHYEEFLGFCSHKLGWADRSLKKENVAKLPITDEMLSVTPLIMEFNQLDLELYEFAVDLYSRRVQADFYK